MGHEPIVQEWWAWSMTGLWMCIWKMIQYSLYIQWDFQGPPSTWDPLEAPYYSHNPTPSSESLKMSLESPLIYIKGNEEPSLGVVFHVLLKNVTLRSTNIGMENPHLE